MHRRFVLPYCLTATCLVTLASCGSSQVGEIRGTVAVDGQPVEAGTISFRPTVGSGKTAGAAINVGQFQLPSDHQLAPGSYSVAVQASKKTGRTFKDPMNGEDVNVVIPLELSDSPKEVELSNESAGNLALEFSIRKK